MRRSQAIGYAIGTLLCVAATAFFNRIGGIHGAKVELCAAFFIAIAPYAGYWTLAYAFVAGLLLDVQVNVFFGCSILLLCGFSFLAYHFANMEKTTFVPCVLVGTGFACAKWVLEVLVAFFRGFSVDFYAGLVKSAFPSMVLTALVTAIFSLIMYKAHTRLRMRDRSTGVRYR